MPQRRELEFATLAEAAAEVDRLASVETTTTGNFSHGQIVRHLAITLDIVSGHTPPPKIPFVYRTLGPLIKRFVLKKPIQPGNKLPSDAQSAFWPAGDVSVVEANKHFHEALARYEATQQLPPHLIFGKMTKEEQDILQRGHIAMHLGFVHPTHPTQPTQPTQPTNSDQ